MELPTYTSIWRIERRLYKLYDFRLPMPLPVSQITVFAGIFVPYVVALGLLGVPFNHTLIWLYVLPPGVATWLVTRPVLEGKRLPELVRSQIRFLAEPKALRRMAPYADWQMVVVTGRVWRLAPELSAQVAEDSADLVFTRVAEDVTDPDAALEPRRVQPRRVREAWDLAEPGRIHHAGTERDERLVVEPGAYPEPGRVSARRSAGNPPMQLLRQPGDSNVRSPRRRASGRPAITLRGAGAKAVRPLTVEEALAGPSVRRGESRPRQVVVVPGGYRPGNADQVGRDRARAQLPLDGHRRIVVLGCTVGGGQTTTALFAAETLASLRSGKIAVQDLTGAGGMAARAASRPALSHAASLAQSALTVLTEAPGVAGERDAAADVAAFERASAEYQMVFADPAASAVPRLLASTDLLLLVAPASEAAPAAIAMTLEWLDAHGHSDLVHGGVMVLNGVSRRSISHVSQAERICVGRLRAIVRVPWDDLLAQASAGAARLDRGRPSATRPSAVDGGHAAGERGRADGPGKRGGQRWSGILSPAAFGAYTALAGVLVAALGGRAESGPAEVGAAEARVAEARAAKAGRAEPRPERGPEPDRSAVR